MSIIYLSLFGALGVLSRHQIENLLKNFITFPYGTFLANTLGCLIAGFLYGLITIKGQDKEMYHFILIGYCGGLTTFSGYALRIFSSMQLGDFTKALLFTVLSIITGLIAVYIGIRLTKLT
jgi:CrcB protein